MSRRKVSKSRYIKGLQCRKLLWLAIHEPEADELKPDLVAQHRFATGHKVGVLARQQFPNGVLLENTNDFGDWISATTNAVNDGHDAIFEAAFANESAFVAVDILRKSGASWDIIEVKSSLSVKDTHLDDLAIQYWLLNNLGISIDKIVVMTLNKECVYPNLSNLFRFHDVTDQVKVRAADAEANIASMQVSLSQNIPDVAIGKHCNSPYECPFKSRCWPSLPEHHISSLYKLNKETAFELERNNGISEIHHLVDEIKLTRLQQRQVDAVKKNSIFVSKDIKAELAKIKSPVSYLDFETIMPTVPIFNGDSPYQQIPAQFSCHIETELGDLKHIEWIATDSSDPRVGMADKLLEACEGAQTIVAYNAKFEKTCLDAIAKAVPEKADRILALKDRFIDLLPLVRNHIYDPNFKGSFSIKSVLPALVQDATYDELDVSNGMVASVKLEQIITGKLSSPEIVSMKESLLRYCALDSKAMLLLKLALIRMVTNR